MSGYNFLSFELQVKLILLFPTVSIKHVGVNENKHKVICPDPYFWHDTAILVLFTRSDFFSFLKSFFFLSK